ncbi:MAG: hydroxymethylglutaryl-CoA lyase, partial [Pseudomonadales bacterium]
MNSNCSTVNIVEVGPRDGLQNESTIIDLKVKLSLIEQLVDSGIKRIEAGAFVHPAKVPQMADSDLLFQQLPENSQVRYSALVPNLKGLERAILLPVNEIAVFAAASEEFSRKNLNASIEESMQKFREVIKASLAHQIPVRGYVSCALGCPFEGDVDPEVVAALAKELFKFGCHEVCLADTIGVGTTTTTVKLLNACERQDLPLIRLAAHFHDTYGQALANSKTALDMGIRTFDAAVGGLGGCPFAPGATGNLATEDLVYMLEGAG